MDVKDGIKLLDAEVKAKLVTGDSFWKTAECKEIALPSVMLSDGPNGMRVQHKRPSNVGLGGSTAATCFPTSSALACSFDLSLCRKVGQCIGEEAAQQGVSMVLGPGVNIKRSPLCGRNFEYYSEDGYLAGKCGAAFIKGVQSTGVSACVKHFAVNSREYARMYYDSRVDEATLRETYLTPFEIAVKEGECGAVMTAYNKLNGVYCNENEGLIRGILRGEWGFDGVVVSDWGGSMCKRASSLRAGADLEMPACRFSSDEIVFAIENGELQEKCLDEAVWHIHEFAYKSLQIERKPVDYAAHAEFARTAAEKCLVLLKNDDSALPLHAGERVALFGDLAEKPRYQGAGSSQVNPTSLDNMLGAIKESNLNFVGFSKGYDRYGKKSKSHLNRALKLADKADTLVVCVGLDEKSECEGLDRKRLSINENQIELLKALAATGKKVIAVLFCGSCVLTDFSDYASALLLAHLGGQGGATAVVRALTGQVNPSGRLAESYPLNEGSEACASVYAASPLKMDFAEGIYVGYKYYNALNVPVKYPFGYGLSYTSFEYSEFAVEEGGVRFKVRNAGDCAGEDVPQIYIRAPREVKTSPYELKLFTKVMLQAGEEKELFLPFDEYSFRVWNANKGKFVAGGEYSVALCRDSAHIVYEGKYIVDESNVPNGCEYAYLTRGEVSFEEYFAARLTEDAEPINPVKGMRAALDMRVEDLHLCRGMLAKIFGIVVKCYKRSSDAVTAAVFDWMPLRTILQFLGYNNAQKEGFLLACDGHFFKGVKKIIFKK